MLEIRNLKKYFPIEHGLFTQSKTEVIAVDGINLLLKEGETLGLVGESGCGKSTTGRLILGLLEPNSGEVIFEGQNILKLRGNKLRQIKKKIQIIFQDPFASLNPRMTIKKIVSEGALFHGIIKKTQVIDYTTDLLKKVGLSKDCLNKYPHEFSGGQRQRIGIARALAMQPKLIIADEPVSALDVSIQAQIINLLQDPQEEFRLTYLFIAHDLSIVKHISHRVAVMYLGRIVELARTDDLYLKPFHPYTRCLLESIPIPDPSIKKRFTILKGEVPSPLNPPSGCSFHPRCPQVMERCRTEKPQLRSLDKNESHQAACLLSGEW
ncbi:MAG: oligopeptide/dipeptide ABC transporter ATP-binding protein [bacterium]